MDARLRSSTQPFHKSWPGLAVRSREKWASIAVLFASAHFQRSGVVVNSRRSMEVMARLDIEDDHTAVHTKIEFPFRLRFTRRLSRLRPAPADQRYSHHGY